MNKIDVMHDIVHRSDNVFKLLAKNSVSKSDLNEYLALCIRHATDSENKDFDIKLFETLVSLGAEVNDDMVEDICHSSYTEFLKNLTNHKCNFSDNAVQMLCFNDRIGPFKNNDIVKALIKHVA